MVLQKVAEFGLERVSITNVVVEGIDGVIDGGTIEVMHGIEVLFIPFDGRLMGWGAVASQRAGNTAGSSFVAINNMLDSASLGEAAAGFVSVTGRFRIQAGVGGVDVGVLV